MPSETKGQLKRELGLPGAIAMGMGSIVGTGVFVSIGIAAGVAGPAVLLALLLAALVAMCNGLNSAQLAASHPMSGGTYEYGYRYLNPLFGFLAGWTFLIAKSASAATAALGFAGYLLNAVAPDACAYLVPLALGAVVLLTLLVLSGIRRSAQVNLFIVSMTALALVAFIGVGIPLAAQGGFAHLSPFFDRPADAPVLSGILHATALMFVAYTGYGRIATLGEEVRDPQKTIPRAVIVTLVLTLLLYMGVAVAGIGAIGAGALGSAAEVDAAPLETAARAFGMPLLPQLVALGAVTAMLGVLLNLVLGLSRVVLAMGRRGDMPALFSRVTASGDSPYAAVIGVSVVIGALVLIGDVKTTWSFSAFSVLIYYAITNLAALKIASADRLYGRWLAWAGLAACLFLAFWVERSVWMIGIGLIAAGVLWHVIAHRSHR